MHRTFKATTEKKMDVVEENNSGESLVEAIVTVEKATDDADVPEVVQDVAEASVAEPSDADAVDTTKIAATNEVTDIGDDSSLHVSNLTR